MGINNFRDCWKARGIPYSVISPYKRTVGGQHHLLTIQHVFNSPVPCISIASKLKWWKVTSILLSTASVVILMPEVQKLKELI